ncbi:MAG: Rne/Rng family ribonuclease [Armatimonadota bacterium]
MSKEIIVNAGELESRVAILENGRLMELHVERDPKIVGNIYKGRVTKVLKGMDAAFVDIGVERNAFLAVSDVVPQEDDDGGNSHGRISRHDLPPINKLLRANQEILAQVVRAPMGTKGARITTRLSLPGRYMVLMLNSGTYVGVSRKIEDPRERQRLRGIATEMRPEGYSLIVRTEAEGKSEEELRGDIDFLMELAHRVETRADQVKAPALVHGDLTLIFRLIRDAFTSDVNRVVLDSPDAYENALELVEMIAPRLKNRVFLYDETLPIFHAYNIEQEIDRMLRRKVWLPSGGHISVDQAEALTAIDVNTGRFVGSVELAETVLTTNLQAAEEVARQLRLRDLGGIIVVDFIDMDNPKHRQQVTKAFEDALRRDRAKIKVHSISALGLVEMTRKRTGESLGGLLTEPCPYCAGIGRVQTPLTMALRVDRELAAAAVEFPDTEAFLVVAHPRVIASMLGYEGEALRDLEQYLERPVYLRCEEDFHPNTYRLERLTLEQALAGVSHLEEDEIVEGVVSNPDPELSLNPLLQARGYFIAVPELEAPVGARVTVRVRAAGTSFASAEPAGEEMRATAEAMAPPAKRPPLVPVSVLPGYLRDELATIPPHGLELLSPTAGAVQALPEEMAPISAHTRAESLHERRRGGKRGRKPLPETVPDGEAVTSFEEVVEEIAEALPVGEEAVTPSGVDEPLGEHRRPRSRRRRRRRPEGTATTGSEDILDVSPAAESGEEAAPAETEVSTTPEGESAVPHEKRRRRRGGVRHRRSKARQAELLAMEGHAPAALGGEEIIPAPVAPEPVAEITSGAEAPAETEESAPAQTRRRRSTRKKHVEQASHPSLPDMGMEAPPTAPPASIPENVETPPVAESAEETPARRAPARRRTTTRRKKTEETPPAEGQTE